ncbi:MAG: hypothetical protein H6936_00640 [Burkholderiales bacterium]|nr:hypothetical protein [Nitrosomonas sp.]MCP5273363.1 hypothetical protein [Burkholderiales bacterium]
MFKLFKDSGHCSVNEADKLEGTINAVLVLSGKPGIRLFREFVDGHKI